MREYVGNFWSSCAGDCPVCATNAPGTAADAGGLRAAAGATVATTPSDALFSGGRLNGWGAAGSYTVLTYSFPTVDPTGPGKTIAFRPFDEALKASARQVFAELAALTNITVVELAAGQGAQLNLMRADLNSGSGGTSIAGLGTVGNHLAGSLNTWIDTSYAASASSTSVKDTLLHEIGHNLGLKHPHDGSPVLDSAIDARANTVMSYNFSPLGDPGSYRWIDREALTRLYGTDANPAAEEVVAGWNAAARRLDVVLTAPLEYAGSSLDEHITATGTSSGSIINAGGGADTVVGSSVGDAVNGNTGDDVIDGGGGADTLAGGQGNDLLLGGDGNDALAGGLGADTLLGGDGNDELRGGDGADSIEGGAGADTLYGGVSGDYLFGGLDDDVFYAGAADTVIGGQGDDTLHAGHASAANPYYSDPTLSVRYNVVAEARLGAGDDLVLALHKDAISGSRLWGGLGSDTIRFGATDDDVQFGYGTAITGFEWIDAGDGNDRIDLGAGNSVVAIEDGDAAALGLDAVALRLAGFETITGGSGNDTIIGSSRGDRILAYSDAVFAGAGNDTVAVTYGWGSSVDAGAGDDLVYAAAAPTGAYYFQSIRIDGGAGNDTLMASWGADTLIGGAGADLFLFQDLDTTSTYAHIVVSDFQASEGDRLYVSGAAGVSSAASSGGTTVSFSVGGHTASFFLSGVSSFDRAWLLG